MTIGEVTAFLEQVAARAYQESYDNAGLLTGSGLWDCKGALICLDCTEEVIAEAIEKNCNLVIAHHPIIFKGLKQLNGKNYVERTVINAIKHDVAIYAIHTNLDNVLHGVNGRIADVLGLGRREILLPGTGKLKKLYTFVPTAKAGEVRDAIFSAGAGQIGHYSECSFSSEGLGSFTGAEGTNPYVGKPGERHYEKEVKLEAVFPAHLEQQLLRALKQSHPYEEVAFDIVPLENPHPQVGSGIVGLLPEPMEEKTFLRLLKDKFNLKIIRHTVLRGTPISRVAVCGGAGSFLTRHAIAAKVDAFVSSDVKYHEFFDADGRLLLTDIGHFESEQFTIDLLYELLKGKFSSFALLKTEVNTNPVKYFVE